MAVEAPGEGHAPSSEADPQALGKPSATPAEHATARREETTGTSGALPPKVDAFLFLHEVIFEGEGTSQIAARFVGLLALSE